MRSFLLCLMCFATPTLAQSPDTVSDRLKTFESGIVCPPPSVGEVEAPGTVAGTTHIIEDNPPFVSNGTQVPAVLGIGFGVKAQIADPFALPGVTVVVTHPAMGDDGATRQAFATRIDAAEPSLTFYQFDFDYELVQGDWQIEAVKDGETLYRKTFQVVPPEDLPALARICGFEHLLS